MVGPLIEAGLEAYEMAKQGKEIYNSLDPKSIIEDAMDPTKPASMVMARARMRSKTGHLLESVSKLIAQRGGVGIP